MIYLDHNATSPLLPEVLDAMMPWLGAPANPASVHRAGQRAAVAVEAAREQVASLVGADPAGVVFTSGATEANHFVVRGAATQLSEGQVVAVSAVEHPCVHAAAACTGREVCVLPVTASGAVRIDAVPDNAGVVSVMAVNHETGVVTDLTELQALAHAGRFVHIDAVQGAARIPLDLGWAGGVVVSSHKLGGPAGVGAAILRSGDLFPSLLSGGAQERGRRAGTVNVAGVVGMGMACAIAEREREQRQKHALALQNQLETALKGLGGRIIGADADRVAAVTCVVFPGVAGEAVVQALDLAGICVSHGAACASGSLEPSPVLTAMGDPDPRGGVRISTGPSTTSGDIDAVLTALGRVLPALQDGWE